MTIKKTYDIIMLALANKQLGRVFFMTLLEAEELVDYTIKAIETDDEELNAFLFSLGCYSGETITVIKKNKKTMTVAIKDGRYCFDSLLANAIKI